MSLAEVDSDAESARRGVKRFRRSCRAAEMGASACCSCSEVTYCCADEIGGELEDEGEVAAPVALLVLCHGCADARWAALRMGGARDWD